MFLAFVGLTGSIIYNALYLQDLHSTSPLATPGQGAPASSSVEMATLPPVSTDLPPLEAEKGGPELVTRAVQRELATRGFDVGPADGKPSAKTTAAISAFQKGQGLPVTGTATDELLRQILLGGSPQPVAGATGSVGAGKPGAPEKPLSPRAKEEAKVKAVQKVLADLGYSPGPVDGAMGGSTTKAISSFQHDRKIAATGKITPEFLRELKRVTGRDLVKTAAGQ
jgi:peptidoglycan hydrolase-like protein with peptidoglycan-binding domain